MTTADPDQHDFECKDAQGADCLLYLLGELDAEARKRFEDRLANVPELSDALFQQAALITAISRTSVLTTPNLQAAAKTTHVYSLRHWRWVAAMASVAACVALIFQLVRLVSEPQVVASPRARIAADFAAGPDESLLIAQAWASSHQTLKMETAESELDELAGTPADEPFELVMDEQPSDIDSTLSWMFVAIASSSDSASSEVQAKEGSDG